MVTGLDPMQLALTLPVQATAVSGRGASVEYEGDPVTPAPVQLHVVGAAALFGEVKPASPSGRLRVTTDDDVPSGVDDSAAAAEGPPIISAEANTAANATADLNVNFTIPSLATAAWRAAKFHG